MAFCKDTTCNLLAVGKCGFCIKHKYNKLCKHPECLRYVVRKSINFCENHGGRGLCTVCNKPAFAYLLCRQHYMEHEDLVFKSTTCSVYRCNNRRCINRSTCRTHSKKKCSIPGCPHPTFNHIKPLLCLKHNPYSTRCTTCSSHVVIDNITTKCFKHGGNSIVCQHKLCIKSGAKLLDSYCFLHRDKNKDYILEEMHKAVLRLH